jgi:hypothetical protein
VARVTSLTTALNEYSKSNEFSFRGDVQRSLLSLQERVDRLDVVRGRDASKAMLRRKLCTPSIGQVTYG